MESQILRALDGAPAVDTSVPGATEVHRALVVAIRDAVHREMDYRIPRERQIEQMDSAIDWITIMRARDGSGDRWIVDCGTVDDPMPGKPARPLALTSEAVLHVAAHAHLAAVQVASMAHTMTIEVEDIHSEELADFEM
jgi:hypothetical protein